MSKQFEIHVLANLQRIAAEILDVGERLTATRLQRSLALSKDDFWEAAEAGYAFGVLKWHDRNFHSALQRYVIPEEAYYVGIQRAVSQLWLSEGFDPSEYHVEDTSRRDAKIVGRWTRPDLTLVSYKKFPWTVGFEFDVVTFEVKRPDAADVLAVFEALSHSSVATRAYVVFPMDEDSWEAINPAQARRVKDECARHGVGLILVDVRSRELKPHHVIRAFRREIDHEKCSDFLDAVLRDEGKRRISKWKT